MPAVSLAHFFLMDFFMYGKSLVGFYEYVVIQGEVRDVSEIHLLCGGLPLLLLKVLLLRLLLNVWRTTSAICHHHHYYYYGTFFSAAIHTAINN